MFKIKYKIELNNDYTISLFGENYFADKKVFWDSHQTRLKNLWEKVNELGMPVTIIEYPDETRTEIENIEIFKAWMKRINLLVSELKKCALQYIGI